MDFINTFLKNQTNQTVGAFFVAIGLSIVSIILGKIVEKSDPMKRPSTLLVLLETYYTMICNLVNSIFKGEMKGLTPYIGSLFIYIISMNYIGFFLPVDSPASDLNVPIGLVTVPVILIHVTNIRYNGFKDYLKGYLDPIPVMLPLNLMDIVSKPLSMSMRLFGNVLSGSLILKILYEATAGLQKLITGFSEIDVIGGIISTPLHLYLDLFSGGIQAFVFTLLTLIFVSLSIDFDSLEGEKANGD